MPFIVIYFAIKRTANKARKENLSKIDFVREKEYFREILKGHSPAELSYIDDFKVVPRREITATLLNLKLKKRIEINENSIKVINPSIDGLKKTEEFILKNINEGKIKIGHSGYIESYAQDEAVEDGLVIKNSDKVREKRVRINTRKKVVLGIVSIIAFSILCNNIERLNESNNIIFNIIFIIALIINSITVIYSFMIAPITGIVYRIMQINSYSRSEKGEELNKKIEGLKQYIKDYSLLNEKEQNDLMLWDEYLIYSVIFDINSTEIVEEISKLIEIEFETGKIYFRRA